jgi:hypothetical protein
MKVIHLKTIRSKPMTHQEELMKDWSLERQVKALSIVAPNLHLFMEYNPEQLMALRSIK